MTNTVIIIRCTNATDRVHALATQISELDEDFDIVAVPDLTQDSGNSICSVIESFKVHALPITEEFIHSKNLHHFDVPARTGWACGDYTLYRALEIEWDYAWIIEPDVYLLNGAEQILCSFESVDNDLIATHLWPAESNWMWYRPLHSLLPDRTIHAMAFPFLRVSRQLAQKSLELRQSLTPQIKRGSSAPNDESIVATTANMHNMSVLDLKVLMPDVFKYWSTALRYPINDIRLRESQPLVVHSGFEHREFLTHLVSLWDSLDKGWENGRAKLLHSFSMASPKTQQVFLEQISARKLIDARKRLEG